jgi:hypothetical protein
VVYASRRYHNIKELELELESQSCAQNVCRHEAAAMNGVILVASQFRLQRFFDMLWGTYVSIYWRKFGVFWWLDHREQGCELGLCGWMKLQAEWMEFLWTIGDENERRMLGSWCVVVGDV